MKLSQRKYRPLWRRGFGALAALISALSLSSLLSAGGFNLLEQAGMFSGIVAIYAFTRVAIHG